MEQHTLTPTQFKADRLLEDRQEVGLREFLDRHHSEGLSLEGISHKLLIATDGEVSVTLSTIRRWLIDFDLLKEAS